MGLRVTRWVALAAIPQGLSRILYVKDGVALDALKTRTRYSGTCAIIDRPEVSVDLSQLQVVRDSRVEDDEAWLRKQEQELVEGARAAIFSPGEGERCKLPLSLREDWREEAKER